jgi:hypothetical protein
MGTVYRKTEKGQAEVNTRQNQLALKLRSALIMVDGRRSDDELIGMLPGGSDELLRILLSEGYIEVIGLTARRPANPLAMRSA